MSCVCLEHIENIASQTNELKMSPCYHYLTNILLALTFIATISLGQQQGHRDDDQMSHLQQFTPHHSSSINLRSTLLQSNQPARHQLRSSSSSIILPANNQLQTIATNIHQPLTTVARIEQQRPSLANLHHNQHLPKNEESTKDLLRDSIEMALRQTSGDESYFQAPTAIDWLASRQESMMQTSSPHLTTTSAPLASYTERITTSTIGAQPQTTTEESNLILDGSSATKSADRSYDPTNQRQQLINIVASTEELATVQSTQPQSVNKSLSLGGSSYEMSNNVVYEGPATAPPAGDFYFPSVSDRLPDGAGTGDYRAPNVWWNIGVGQEFERASNLTKENFFEYCAKSEILVSDKQRSLCKTHPKIMAVAARGLRLAFDECQLRFSTGRWNCSMVLAESMESQNHLTPRSQPFGEVMQKPNRERSFLNAIISAGLAHAMTKACSQGELPEECSCDKRIRSKSNRGKIEWVACSDDIDYGARFSRDFTDLMEGDTDTTSMINSHNYEVGRRIFKSATDITCSCPNGENGLCQTKRCWKHLSPFSEIGDELVRRYESATHVQVSSKDPRKLRPVRRGVRRPKRKDLVFIEESPDYCDENSRLGILGTQNRRCNSTTLAVDSCSILCCGRGYQVAVEEIEEDCNCKFVWCCKVKCDRCKRQMTVNICN